MPTLLIDDFSDETLWSALTPANAPSAEVALSTDGPAPVLPAAGSSMRVALSAASANHRIERTFVAIDLSGFAELRFWIRADAPASGAPSAPFRLVMQLGSAALPIGDPGNDWLRYVPIAEANRWSLVRVALDDLAPAVRTGLDRVALRSMPGSGALTFWLDDLRAAAPAMTLDAHAAVLNALDGQLLIGGTPVPAVIQAPGAAIVAPPCIDIVNYDVQLADRRGGQGQRRADFTDTGYRIWPEPEPWDLFYRIGFVTADPIEQATMLDFTLMTLGGRSPLNVEGHGHPFDRIPNVLPDDALAPSPLLRYRLATWLERGSFVPVQPVTEVRLATGMP